MAAADGTLALLAWEQQVDAAAEQRRIELRTLTAEGQPTGRRAWLEFRAQSGSPPLAATSDGFATLTLSQARVTPAPSEDSGEPLVLGTVPSYVRFSSELAVRAAEPVRVAGFGATGIPSFVRGFDCSGARCTALAAGSDNPALLALVELPERPSPWVAPAKAMTSEATPRPTGLSSVQSTSELLAEVAATRVADGRELVAWLTHFAPTSAGAESNRSAGAALAVRLVGPESALGETRTISTRAFSTGGVALEQAVAAPTTGAAARGKNNRQPIAVLAWAGPNNNVPQVFLTQIGSDGQKLTQKTLTQLRAKTGAGTPIELFDVDIARDGLGGYVVAWTDTRAGNPEIYAARVGPSLDRSGPEVRVTTAAGSSAEVRVAVRGERVLLVWSDSRDRVDEGLGDIYLAQLETRTLKKVGADQRLFESEGQCSHARHRRGRRRVLVWWIEEPGGGHAAAHRARLAARSPRTVGGHRARATPTARLATPSATLGCTADSCRVRDASFVGARCA